MFIRQHFANTEFHTYSELCIQFSSDFSKLGHLKTVFLLKLAVDAGNSRVHCVLIWHLGVVIQNSDCI